MVRLIPDFTSSLLFVMFRAKRGAWHVTLLKQLPQAKTEKIAKQGFVSGKCTECVFFFFQRMYITFCAPSLVHKGGEFAICDQNSVGLTVIDQNGSLPGSATNYYEKN